MIRVNLLPEEYRKVESTSLSLFLLFLVGVILVALSFVFWLMLSLQGGGKKAIMKERQDYLTKVTNDAKIADKIKEELAQYDKRLTTIMGIRSGRIYWSKKLDLLVQDTPRRIWFTSVRMKQNDPIRVALNHEPDPNRDGGYLEFACYQMSDDYQILAAYRDKLMQDRVLYADFSKIQAPHFTIMRVPDVPDDDATILSFTVVLQLKPQVVYTTE